MVGQLPLLARHMRHKTLFTPIIRIISLLLRTTAVLATQTNARIHYCHSKHCAFQNIKRNLTAECQENKRMSGKQTLEISKRTGITAATTGVVCNAEPAPSMFTLIPKMKCSREFALLDTICRIEGFSKLFLLILATVETTR